MPHALQPPIKRANEWEIDVPGDNSCLFWAATCAYLVPVIDDPSVFETRCLRLFGAENSDKVDLIKTLFSSYNPFSAQEIFKHPTINSLVREQFRSRIIEYIATHKEKFAEFWVAENPQLENGLADYLSRMQDPDAWGGDFEITAISQLLDCTIRVQGNNSSVQTYSSTNNTIIVTLIHANTADEGENRPGNHYHFTIEESVGDAYQVAVHSAQRPLTNAPLFTAISSEQQKILAKEESAHIEYKCLQDKIADLKILFILTEQLEDFLKQKNHPKAITQENISGLLGDIAQAFSTLKWKNKSEQHIRNLYGKMNYKKGLENPEYIDFERLSLLHSFPDQTSQHNIAKISHKYVEFFLEDIVLLFNNLLSVLHKELISPQGTPSPYINKECLEIKQYVSGKGSSLSTQLSPLKYLLPLLDIHYDPLFLKKICQTAFLKRLAEIDQAKDDVKWRYTLARILTIMGEAANNLSDSFKNRYCYLPFTTLVKLRDQFAHAHHQHIAKNNVTTMQFLSEVENELASLQQALDPILNTFPETIDQQAMSAHSASLNELIPIALQTAVSQPFPFDQLTSLAPDDINLLRAARIAFIEKVQKSVNPHIQIDQSETEYQNTIATLEAKATLNAKQERQLTAARKKLEELNNRKLAEGLPEELARLRMLPSFRTLLQHFTLGKANTSEKSNTTDKKSKRTDHLLNSQVHSLEEEIIRLKALYDIPPQSERNYATEHSIAIIGQLSKDLSESKTQLLKQIFQENETIQHAFSQNASARNQKVMHDPFNDNTPVLKSVILNDTLPLLPDVSALKLILSPHTLEDIQSNAIITIINTYTAVANAFLRLNLLSDAEKYFQLALNYTTPEHFAKLQMQEAGLPPSDEAVVSSVAKGSGYIIEQGNTIFITTIDLQWALHHVSALVSLAQCQIKQHRPDLAIPHLKEASTHIELMAYAPKYYSIIQSNLYIASLQNGGKLNDLPDLERLMQSDYDQYVNTLTHFAHRQWLAKKYEKGSKALSEIDTDKITDKKLLIHFYQTLGFIFDGRATEYYEWGKAQGGLVADEQGELLLFSARQASIGALRLAYHELTTNRANLKFAHGTHLDGLEEHLALGLSKAMGSQAKEYLEYDLHEDEGYKLIRQAIALQKKYHYDTSISYGTLGTICEKRYEQTSDLQYLEEGLVAYAENTQHSDTRVRATAYAGKAYILFKLDRIYEALKNSIESLFYYSKVAENEIDSFDSSDMAYLNKEIKKTVQLKLGLYKQVLSDYVEAGEEYQANDNPIKAAACYQKCLLALKYVTDIRLQQKVEAKLQICESRSPSSSASTVINPISYLTPSELTSINPIGPMASL